MLVEKVGALGAHNRLEDIAFLALSRHDLGIAPVAHIWVIIRVLWKVPRSLARATKTYIMITLVTSHSLVFST